MVVLDNFSSFMLISYKGATGAHATVSRNLSPRLLSECSHEDSGTASTGAPRLPHVPLHLPRSAPKLLQRGPCPSEPSAGNSFSSHISQPCHGVGRTLSLEFLLSYACYPTLENLQVWLLSFSFDCHSVFFTAVNEPNCPQILCLSDCRSQHSQLDINLPLHLYERTRKSFVCVFSYSSLIPLG